MDVTGSPSRKCGGPNADAYLGISVPGFPNLFLIGGPGTVLGHGGSYITIAESEVRYIVEALTGMAGTRIGALEVRPRSTPTTPRRHDAAHARMIWSHPGMGNWYRNSAGRVVSALPWRIVDYWTMTRHVHWDDFTTEPPR